MAITRVYLTEKGADLLAKAQIGSTIAFTRAEVGEGPLPAGTVITQMASLVQPVKEIYPSRVTVQEGQAAIQLNFTNQGVGRPFFWYEVGVYATDPDVGEILYAYGNAMEAEHADEIPAILTEFLFNVILKVQNTENVTVNVDKSLVYSTQEEFQAHADSKANPHGVTKAQVGLGNVNNTADANKPVSTAQKAAIDAVQANLSTHAGDTVKHVTAAERTKWDTVESKAPADMVAYLGEGSITGTLLQNADTLGGQPGSYYATATGLQAANVVLKGKAEKIELSNRNLLDNWYLTDPVNQRGQTSYTGIGYTVDRWKLLYDGTVTINDSALTLAATSQNTELAQYLEMPYKDLAGKTVCISALLNSGAVSSYGTVPVTKPCIWTNIVNIVTDFGFVQFNYDNAVDRFFFSVIASGGKSVTIQAAKLEVGTISTLANSLPPNEALELMKCQRYYIKTKVSRIPFVIADSTSLWLAIALPVAMRLNRPTITSFVLNNWLMHQGHPYDFNLADGVPIPVSEYRVEVDGSVEKDGNIAIHVTLAQPMTTPVMGSIGMIASVSLELDANL